MRHGWLILFALLSGTAFAADDAWNEGEPGATATAKPLKPLKQGFKKTKVGKGEVARDKVKLLRGDLYKRGRWYINGKFQARDKSELHVESLGRNEDQTHVVAMFPTINKGFELTMERGSIARIMDLLAENGILTPQGIQQPALEAFTKTFDIELKTAKGPFKIQTMEVVNQSAAKSRLYIGQPIKALINLYGNLVDLQPLSQNSIQGLDGDDVCLVSDVKIFACKPVKKGQKIVISADGQSLD